MDIGLAPLTTGSTVTALAGLAMLALAAWVWNLHPRLAVNRAFAAFLVWRGFTNLFLVVTFTMERTPGLTFTVGETLDLFLVFALVPFVLAYRRHQHGVTTSRLWYALLALGAAGIAAAWLWDPTLGPHWKDPGLTIFSLGPLLASVSFLYWGTLLATALVLVHDATVTRDGPAQASNLLLSFALLAFPVHFTTSIFLQLVGGSGSVEIADFPPGLLAVLVPVLVIVSAGGVVATVALYRGANRRGRPSPGAVRRYALATLLPLLTAVIPGHAGLAGLLPNETAVELMFLLGAFWLLAMPVIAAYALVRHQLFGVDAKVKLVVRQSTVAAAFVGVFFVVSEGTATVLSGRWGPLLGIAAAGLLVFALAPLQQMAERLADAAMPGVSPTPELDGAERLSIYRDQVRFAWADQAMSREERVMLGRLRERLGLSPEEALAVEEGVLQGADPGG